MAQQSSQATTDHEEIRQWVEKRGGHPATIEGTPSKSEAAGLLRIDFPTGSGDPPLNAISWDDFFDKFEEAKLALIYQEKTSNGKPSYFCKFIRRDGVES